MIIGKYNNFYNYNLTIKLVGEVQSKGCLSGATGGGPRRTNGSYIGFRRMLSTFGCKLLFQLIYIYAEITVLEIFYTSGFSSGLKSSLDARQHTGT